MVFFSHRVCFKKNVVIMSFLLFSVVARAGYLINNSMIELFASSVSLYERFDILLENIKTDDKALEISEMIESEGCSILRALIDEFNIYVLVPTNKDYFSRNGLAEGSDRGKIISLLFNLFIMSTRGNSEYNKSAAIALAKIINSEKNSVFKKIIMNHHKVLPQN